MQAVVYSFCYDLAMALFFITGSAGTGKSTVCQALKQIGHEAYDTDTDGLAKWTNLQTGYIHPKSSVKKADRTPEFLNTHGWHVSRQDIEQLSANANSQTTFLCGLVDNLDELIDLFDGIFALYIDKETLRHRLANRTDNDWGTQKHELQRTLAGHRTLYDEFRKLNAIIIDASKPISEVTTDILTHTH